MRQVNINVIPPQAAATITSAPIPALNLFSCSVMGVTTGAAAGVIVLQASNDDFQSGAETPINFAPITGATVTITTAGTVIIPKLDICYQWLRVVYTNTGTGTISVVFKAIGE